MLQLNKKLLLTINAPVNCGDIIVITYSGYNQFSRFTIISMTHELGTNFFIALFLSGDRT